MEQKTSSIALNELNAQKDKKTWSPNSDQQEVFSFYYNRIIKAKQARDQRRREFDDLDYETDYELNKRAANTYLRKKINDDEVRVATTATEKRIEIISNELSSLNLQPEVLTYDKDDNMQKELGTDFQDIVRRTNEIEKDDDMWGEAINELLTQRALFIEELDEYITIKDRPRTIMGPDGPVSEGGKYEKYVIHRPRKRIVSGLQVFLGDITIPAIRFQEQPYIVKYYKKSYAEAKAVYGEYPNFKKYVKQGGKINYTIPEPSGLRLYDNGLEEVEELHYIDPYNDEYMVMINGVFMWDKPIACPWEITADRKYNMTMVVLKSMGRNFAYGKSLTASTKTLQGLSDETFRLLIRKFRQAIEPPIAVKGNKIYSKEIWTAGVVVQGLSSKSISLLNPNNHGVTTSEFNMAAFIDKMIDESVGVPKGSQSISDGKGTPTATQIINEQKNFIKMLGHSIQGLMRAKRDCTYLRIYNLVENFTKPVGTKIAENGEFYRVFQKYTVNNGDFGNGQSGRKIIQFIDQDLTREDKEEVFRRENQLDRSGDPTRFRFINIKRLQDIPYFWFVVVNQKERDGGALDKALFEEKLNAAVNVSQIAQRPINGDTIVEDYEETWKTKNMFQKAPQQATQGGGPEQQQQGDDILQELDSLEKSPIADQIQEGAVAGQTNKPSLNNIVDQA